MVEVFVDNFGRIVLPKKIRKQFETRRFSAEIVKDKIVLEPAKGLETLLGAAKGLDVKDFIRWKRAEAKRENLS